MFLSRIFAATLLLTFCFADDCRSRDFGESSIVCVCDATYCDTLPTADNNIPNTYQLITSNKAGLRFNTSISSISENSELNLYSISLDHSVTHQTILGFGGAFTDATGINIASLSDGVQKKLLDSYFSKDGSEYSLGRVPIGGADFSPRGYSYADDSEGSLDSWALQDEDHLYKIPYILKARNLTDEKLLLLASPWSSPPWMKTNNAFSGAPLKKEYHKMWADYIMKFFEAYKENDIDFWAYTLQNEPQTGILGADINSIAWQPEELVEWLTRYIGPAIRNSSFSDINIIVNDDNSNVASNVLVYLNNVTALSYLDGVAFHWYTDKITDPSLLNLAKTSRKKDIFMFYSEASEGIDLLERPVILGSWERAEDYASSILHMLLYDGVGWIDWNLALSTKGGPTYIYMYLDSPIIVDAIANEFYKQPMYYALAHFSKYVPRGSVRIGTFVSPLADKAGIKAVAFNRPDKRTTLQILNTGTFPYPVKVQDEDRGFIYVTIEPNSINTIIY